MKKHKVGSGRKARTTSVPALESLEGRRLMAAKIAQVGVQEVTSQGYLTLVVTGTNRADVINVTDNGTGTAGNVTVTLGDGSSYTSQGAIATIAVQGKGGNDAISYTLTGDLVAVRTVAIDLGTGNDKFTANLNGAIANPTGIDLEAYGGAGSDNLTVNQSGAALNGTTIAYLQGDAGNDTLNYNGTGAIASAATVIPALSGDAGNDAITSTYVGKIDGNYIYNLSIDGGAGNDNIVDLISAEAGSSGLIGASSTSPAAVRGGAGNDHIMFGIVVDPSVSQATVTAVVAGDSGKDTIQRTANVLGDRTNEADSIIS